MKMEGLCRICLMESKYYLNIYGDGRLGNSLNFEDINDVYNLQIRVDDALPRYVCRECTMKIREFKEWKIMAHKAKLKLFELQNQIQVMVRREVEEFESSINIKERFRRREEEGFHTEVLVKQEVEESSAHNEENLKEKEGNLFHSELIIKEDVEKNNPNTARNLEIRNYVPSGDHEAKEPRDIITYTSSLVEENRNYGRGSTRESYIDIESDNSLGSATTTSGNSQEGKRRWKCDYCFRAFAFPSILAQHILIHTGVKPHSCQQCGKQFSSKGNLKTHYLIHTDEKPFKCMLCRKRFRAKGNLAQHYRIHSAERPFECATCGMSFKAKSNLLVHQAKHTNESQYMETIQRTFPESIP